MSLKALAVVSAMTMLPGLGASLALWKPGEASVVVRLGVAAAFGYGTVAVIAFFLSVVHQLAVLPFALLFLAATLTFWAIALRSSSVRDHVEAIQREIREDPWALGAGIAVVVAIAVIRFGFGSHIFVGASGFRYWADGLEVADSHGIPSSAIHYGGLHPPTTSKVLFNSFNAAMTFVLGRDPFRALPPLLWIGSVGLALALWSLGRELGLRMTAPLLPVLVVMNRVFLNDELTNDMAAYKAEVLGRVAAVGALVLCIRALRRGAWVPQAVAGGVLFAVAAGTHLVPTLIAGALLASFGIAHIVLGGGFKSTATRGAVIAGVSALVALFVLVLPRGEIGFGGAVRSNQYEEFRRREGFDPTFFLVHGDLAHARKPPPQGTWYFPPGYLFRVFMSEALPLGSRPTYLFGIARSGVHSMAVSLVLLFGGVALAVGIFLLAPPKLRPLGPMAVGLGIFMFAVVVGFSLRYDVYLLARFGLRRIQDYSSVPIVLLGLAALEGGLLRLKRLSVLPVQVGAAIVVVVAAAAILPSGRSDPNDALRGKRLQTTLERVRRAIPCSSRILASARTSGTFQAATGRVGLLEGMAPYLRPAMLREVVTLFRSAQAFFRDPGNNRRFLEREGVDYVIVVSGRVPLGFLTYDLKASSTRLARTPFLAEVLRSPDLRIFRVTGQRRAGTLPNPARQPGFRCVTSSAHSSQ